MCLGTYPPCKRQGQREEGQRYWKRMFSEPHRWVVGGRREERPAALSGGGEWQVVTHTGWL